MKHLLILISFLLLSSPVIGDKETQIFYNGEVKNEKLHGLGVMIFNYGIKYVGEYRDGLPWTGRFYEKNSDFSYGLVNGKKPIGD